MRNHLSNWLTSALRPLDTSQAKEPSNVSVSNESIAKPARNLQIAADIISILSQIARTSPSNVDFVTSLLEGPAGNYNIVGQLMGRNEVHPVLASRTCALLGNIMKHKSDFSAILKQNPALVESIVKYLQNEDSNVRKVCFAFCP